MKRKPEVLWLCDRQCPACLKPGLMTCTNDQCFHTADRAHAINLKNSPDRILPKAFQTYKNPDGRTFIFEREEIRQ